MLLNHPVYVSASSVVPLVTSTGQDDEIDILVLRDIDNGLEGNPLDNHTIALKTCLVNAVESHFGMLLGIGLHVSQRVVENHRGHLAYHLGRQVENV
jgi:hypothetical protein